MLIIEPPPDPHLVLQTIVDLKVSHVLFFLDICLDAKTCTSITVGTSFPFLTGLVNGTRRKELYVKTS